MNRFKNILFVPSANLTEPDDSFRKAVKLAADNGAALKVFGVIYDKHLSNKTIEELIYNERLPELAGLATCAKEQGVAAQFKLTTGIPFLKIIREVLQHNHDLVISHLVPSHGIKDWIFGGTNLHLLRKCPCPVWVMTPRAPQSYRQILAAVDPCSTEPGEGELNIKIVEMAASMALREQGRLHLLHAWPHAAEDLIKARHRLPAGEVDRILAVERGKHRSKFEAFVELAKERGAEVEAHFVEGPPAHVIPEQVAGLNIDLLVMGTICRTGIAGFLIGNTAEQVLELVQCPLLAVKPVGFQTPVTPGK